MRCGSFSCSSRRELSASAWRSRASSSSIAITWPFLSPSKVAFSLALSSWWIIIAKMSSESYMIEKENNQSEIPLCSSFPHRSAIIIFFSASSFSCELTAWTRSSTTFCNSVEIHKKMLVSLRSLCRIAISHKRSGATHQN
jgi:hypothetical protein